ncbi:uncharacterized protein [Littorina saxatilis]|uniref:uncharacterized protein n=1 Tax=Littorina saxatilis TaxID=31220 RepID=UPI0038B4C532
MKAIIYVVAVLCCALNHASAYRKRVRHEVLELSDQCPELYVDVEQYDVIDIKSMEENEARHSVSAGASCVAFFETSLPDHGLCIRMHGVLIMSSHFRLEFLTGPYGADRIIQRGTNWRGDWCFPHRLVAVKVMTSHNEEHMDRAAIYAFTVTNVTLDKVPRTYYMDSFVECGLSHTLVAGQKVHIQSQRDPPVTPDLPSTCELTLESTSEDEYEQLCLELEVIPPRDLDADDEEKAVVDVRKNLVIEGLNTRFYSSKEARNGLIACSGQKRLKLILTRTEDANFNFKATVTSQWHPLWEAEESEAAELRGLRIVKGITYFIATIDSLVAVLVAGLAAILKRPTGPWRRWAEHFNAQTAAHAPQAYPPVDPANYGSMHTCKDGNYPELPLEGATPVLRERNEVLVEAHTY